MGQRGSRNTHDDCQEMGAMRKQGVSRVTEALKNASLTATVLEKANISQALQPNPGMGGSKKQQFITKSVAHRNGKGPNLP